jgi:MFS family permease
MATRGSRVKLPWAAALWHSSRVLPSTSNARAATRWVLVGLAFWLSGAAALVYQVVWQRILAFHTGVGITSVALIVSAFMAGLGIGSHVGGALSARVGPRAALLVFAAIEGGIGVFAAGSARLYYEGLARLAAPLYQSPAGIGLAHFLALLVPTLLMGMSLPFLVRAMVRDVATASRAIATLYGVNVLGASLGAIVAPWLLVRFYGMEGAVLWGAGANLVAALAALLAGTRHPPPDVARAPAAAPDPPAPSEPDRARSLSLWTLLYGWRSSGSDSSTWESRARPTRSGRCSPSTCSGWEAAVCSERGTLGASVARCGTSWSCRSPCSSTRPRP